MVTTSVFEFRIGDCGLRIESQNQQSKSTILAVQSPILNGVDLKSEIHNPQLF
jgi:hypothetical protein